MAYIKRLWTNSAETWYDDIYYWTELFDTSLVDLDFDSRSEGCKAAKTSEPLNSQSTWFIWMKGLSHWDLYVRWTSYSFYVVQLIFRWEKQLVMSWRAPLMLNLHSDIYRSISFQLCMMRGTNKLYILIPVWMTLRKQKFCCCFLFFFLANFSIHLDDIWKAAMTCSVQADRMIYIQGNKLHFGDVMKNVFNIGLCLDAYELIFYVLGMMINMTKLYILIPFVMTVTFTQVTVTRKL